MSLTLSRQKEQPHPEKLPPQLSHRKHRRPKKKTHGDALEVVQDKCENTAVAARRAAKRRAQPEEETRDFGGEAKRKHWEPNVLLPVKSPDETTMPANTGDNAYKETRAVEHYKELNSKNAVVSLATGSEEDEEDIDVIGALGSFPDPVTITWSLTSGSEGEEELDEEIDVVGGADLTFSPVAFTVSNAVDRMCHAEVPLC